MDSVKFSVGNLDKVKAEMQRLCEVILEAEAKRAELAAFIVEAE